jgi:lactate 2-monooxygenase
MTNFGAYQDEIYLAGLTGTLPKLPVDFATLEKQAHAAMPPSLVSYVAGGCGNEHTQRANVAAFEHWGVIPRMLAARPVRELSIKLFGLDLPRRSSWHPSECLGCARKMVTAIWPLLEPRREARFR